MPRKINSAERTQPDARKNRNNVAHTEAAFFEIAEDVLAVVVWEQRGDDPASEIQAHSFLHLRPTAAHMRRAASIDSRSAASPAGSIL